MVAKGTSDPPEKQGEPPSGDGALHSLVRVESLIQLGCCCPLAW